LLAPAPSAAAAPALLRRGCGVAVLGRLGLGSLGVRSRLRLGLAGLLLTRLRLRLGLVLVGGGVRVARLGRRGGVPATSAAATTAASAPATTRGGRRTGTLG